MPFTRNIYWNVGEGASTLFPMYLIATVAIAICLFGLWKRVQVYRLGRDLGRFDNRSERIVSALKNIFLQKRVMETGSGHELFNQKLDMQILVYKALIEQGRISSLVSLAGLPGKAEQ